jgi:hypothetical protein
MSTEYSPLQTIFFLRPRARVMLVWISVLILWGGVANEARGQEQLLSVTVNVACGAERLIDDQKSGDNFTTAAATGEQHAHRDYVFARVEGYVYPSSGVATALPSTTENRLPAPTPPSPPPSQNPSAGSGLTGKWTLNATCGSEVKKHEMHLNQGSDGKFSGTLAGL